MSGFLLDTEDAPGSVARNPTQARFAGKILPIDAAIADRWGLLAGEAKRKGKALPIIDGLSAATALHHNLTVVSRNAGDFTYTHVQVLNPWEA
jgi:predicted nucleic acid-binding protein